MCVVRPDTQKRKHNRTSRHAKTQTQPSRPPSRPPLTDHGPARVTLLGRGGPVPEGEQAVRGPGTHREPYNFAPMGVKSISPAHLHVRPCGARVRGLMESRKGTHPKDMLPLFSFFAMRRGRLSSSSRRPCSPTRAPRLIRRPSTPTLSPLPPSFFLPLSPSLFLSPSLSLPLSFSLSLSLFLSPSLSHSCSRFVFHVHSRSSGTLSINRECGAIFASSLAHLHVRCPPRGVRAQMCSRSRIDRRACILLPAPLQVRLLVPG